MAWTDPATVIAALGESAAPPLDDPYLQTACDAANAAAFRKRRAAGYTDDADDPPDAAVAYGTTLWAVALWRERVAVDGFASFEDLAGYMPTGGSWGQIRRLLGIGRAQVDGLPAEAAPILERRARRRLARLRGAR